MSAFAAERMETAPAVTRGELIHAHHPDYVDAVLNGTLDARAQREIGLPWSPELAERSRRSVGATVAASRSALLEGCGVNLAGGTHHAGRERGSGFCMFNDIAVASMLLLAEARVRRVLIVDLDVHQGDGTAAIAADEPRIFTFSMHGARNFPFRRVDSDWDIDLPDGTEDAAYLDAGARAAGTVRPRPSRPGVLPGRRRPLPRRPPGPPGPQQAGVGRAGPNGDGGLPPLRRRAGGDHGRRLFGADHGYGDNTDRNGQTGV